MGLWIFGTNSTTPSTWVDSPNGRGTWDILSSCIITLGLCVLSAIHVNVPPWQWSNTLKIMQRIRWLILALIAPELVAYNAWCQRNEAKEMTRLLRENYGQPRLQSKVVKVCKRLFRIKVGICDFLMVPHNLFPTKSVDSRGRISDSHRIIEALFTYYSLIDVSEQCAIEKRGRS